MTGKRKYAGRPKRYFKHAKFSDGGASKLEIGMKGVLISHDRNREKSCRIDSFRLLNHFADKLFGPEKTGEEEKEDRESDDEDIESALSTEISDIKNDAGQKSQHRRRFSTVKSGCNNLIFIRCKEVSPSTLMKNVVETIFSRKDLEGSDIPCIRNVLRVHPVEFTCSAYLDTMCKDIPPFLETKFLELADTDTKEFTIEYKCRNNSHLSRQGVLDGLVKIWNERESGWKYNCRTQSVSVIIDILKTVCLVTVVKDYNIYKKYNIRELQQMHVQPGEATVKPKSDDCRGEKTEKVNEEKVGDLTELDENPKTDFATEGESVTQSSSDVTEVEEVENKNDGIEESCYDKIVDDSNKSQLECDDGNNECDGKFVERAGDNTSPADSIENGAAEKFDGSNSITTEENVHE